MGTQQTLLTEERLGEMEGFEDWAQDTQRPLFVHQLTSPNVENKAPSGLTQIYRALTLTCSV